MTLDKPFKFRNYTVTLSNVAPEKISSIINPSDYQFTFTLNKSADSSTTSIDSFAQCIKDKGAVMYGASWCPHCQAQKELFGENAKNLPYVECSSTANQSQAEICTKNKIKGYPTWRFKDGSEVMGEMKLQDLAQKTGCSLN